jgi:hypothetical protein
MYFCNEGEMCMTDSNVVCAFTKSFVEAYRSYGLPEGEFSYLDFNTMTTVLVIPKEEMPEYLQELLDSEGSELIDNNLYYIEIDRDEDGDECFSVMEKLHSGMKCRKQSASLLIVQVWLKKK